ncbi:ATP-binding protein [Streptomyces sp. NPDC059649]|uniref:ATP-binding protein n=1 Tax=Streptomyces sp. NPDC059649 TaxID=3346895 RepID=UPI003693CF8E
MTDDTNDAPPAAPPRAPAVPRPAGPPPPAAPPPPIHTPAEQPPLLGWLRAPRPTAAPGIWTYGHRLKVEKDPEEAPLRRQVTGALFSAFCGWLLWSLLWNGYLGPYWLWPLQVLGPSDPMAFVWAAYIWYGVVAIGLIVVFGRLGHWWPLLRRLGQALQQHDQVEKVPPPAADPAQWPELRAAGLTEAADRLAADARAGRMNDVDVARIAHAWRTAQNKGTQAALDAFGKAVMHQGAAAYEHPSGRRDVPRRTAHHDLLTRQVRIGIAADQPRNPYQHRGAGIALSPPLLGTSLLAVGPAGSGKTTSVVRPVTESLCLQALAGQCSLVAVGPASAPAGPDALFDVIVRPGRPGSADIDLYGGTTDPDEAAGILAEALVGDLGDHARRAAVALGQLLGAHRTARSRFPSVAELRELLDGAPGAMEALRADLEAAGHAAALRELDARARQAQRPDDVGAHLADRIAVLDRPAFADLFDPTGRTRQVSLRALDRPLRVRIDLPDRGHVEASRILARLILAQFAEAVVTRPDRSLFACLVLDDMPHVVTQEALRSLQRVRSAHAGVLLTLRALEDVPEALRSALLGAVGCRMAFAGVTPGDGARFAEVWGKEWVETRDVTDRQIIAEGAGMKAWHIFRQAVTGKAVTAKAVTVRTVERERWSASDLANSVPAGHAVISVASARGEHSPPILVNLR